MPPELLPFTGNWEDYQNRLSEIFTQQIARGNLVFRGTKVTCRRIPEHAGEWFGFWHLISEGRFEADRTPDLRRCERLKWIAWIINNADERDNIDVWENEHRREKNVLLWFREEYIVILARRNGYFLLKTAYCTDRTARVRQLQKQRDKAL